MSKRVRCDQRVGSKVAKFLKYICRRDPSTYQNTPGPSGHTNV